MDQDTLITFLVLVFATVFLLSQIIIVPTFGTDKQEAKRLKKRLDQVGAEGESRHVSLVRQKYLKRLSALEKWLESLPGMASLNLMIEQSGRLFPAYRVVLICLGLAVLTAFLTWQLSHHSIATLVLPLIAGWLPILKLKKERQKRLDKFEEQLPEALNMMSRALRAGYPFTESMAYIAKEMEAPIAQEFGITFDEINYGGDVKTSFNYMLARVPSLSLMAMMTSVLIQRETGGNLAEVLDKISSVLRGRFRFQRRVKTLSAEGRISAWVLALIPFVMFVLISFLKPDYFTPMFADPIGKNLIILGLVLLVVGSFWIRKMIRIEV